MGYFSNIFIGVGSGLPPADWVVTNDAEWATAIAGATDGQIIELSGTNFTSLSISNKTYATGLTVRCANDTSKVPNISLSGTCSRITFKNVNFQMTGWPKNYTGNVHFVSATLSNITFDGCTFRHGYGASQLDLVTDFDYPEYERIDNVITATTTSSRIPITYKDTTSNVIARFEMFNRSTTTPVYYKFGDSTVTATLSDTLFNNNASGTAYVRTSNYTFASRPTHIAAITASGTAELNARSEIGLPQYLGSPFFSTGGTTNTNLTIKNCTFTDMQEGIKSLGRCPGNGGTLVIMDNTFLRLYSDQISLELGGDSLGTGAVYILRNTLCISMARSGIAEALNGDAYDPHGDLFQIFNNNASNPVYNVISAGNRVVYQPLRTGVSQQGLFWSDSVNLTTGYQNAYSISDALLGGATNGIAVGESGVSGGPVDGLYVYGATIIDMATGASSVSTMRVWPKSGTYSFVEKSLTYDITNEHTGSIVETGNYELSVSAPSPITTILPNFADWSTSTTVSQVENTITTTGAAAGIGAVATRNSVDWATSDPASVVKWETLPPGVYWPAQINLTASTLYTTSLVRVLNRKTGQTVVPGTGVEWRSYEADGTTLDTDWTTSSGTIDGLQWIQIRTTSSGTAGATLTRTITINGFAVSTDFTTLAPAVNTYLTNSQAFGGDETSTIASGSSRLFSGVNFGTPDAKRVIVVAVYTGGSSHSDVKIGGVSGTEATGVTATGRASIWYRAVSSGTSGDIEVFNTSGTAISRVRVLVWAIYPTSSTHVDGKSASATTTTNAVTAALSVNNGGYVVWIGAGTSASATYDTIWGGVDTPTRDVSEASLESIATVLGGHIDTTQTSSFTFTLDPTGATSNTKFIAAASWGA